MRLYSEHNDYKLYQSSMLDMLEVIDKESIDTIVTDPPYELNFMGKGWDNAGVSFNKDTWQKCFEVLKEGGYLLAFGGSRTYHRIACAIEDAGFEIRDCIMWLYGSGFPKSQNIGLMLDKKRGIDNRTGNIIQGMGSNNTESMNNHQYETQNYKKNYEERKAQNEWQGWGTCLKPAYEPIIIARKPFKGSLVDNVIKNGVGGLNIDECRVETTDIKRKGGATTNGNLGWKPSTKIYNNGRFPANVIHDGSYEVCEGFPYTKSQKRSSKYNKDTEHTNTYTPVRSDYRDDNTYSDSGSAIRYFYCAKASKKDRDEGLDTFEDRKFYSTLNTKNGSGERLDGGQTPIRKNIHPTVKPTELMQYLVRLVAPKGATILDPFNGSGSTGKAVMYENKERNANYKYIGIELTEEYLPIATARIEYVINLKNEAKEFEQLMF